MPTFANKAEKLAYLVANKSVLMAQKSLQVKHADAICLAPVKTHDKNDESKALSPGQIVDLMNSEAIKATLVINTTNIMDSHSDVHFPGIWKKSLQERRELYLLQEHRLTFDGIITDEVKAEARTMKWNEMGLPYIGETQALIFEVTIQKDRNSFMFEQYAKGRVKNHSVGMRYVKYTLAVDSALYPEEKEIWDKYIDQIVNKEEVQAQGYFWAVTEAKAIEGSAVPIGSNTATPTLQTEVKNIVEPVETTQQTTGAGLTTPKQDNLSIYQFN